MLIHMIEAGCRPGSVALSIRYMQARVHGNIRKHGVAAVMQVMSAMEKLSTRERFLNSQCEHLTAEYREAKEALSQMQEHFNQKQDAAAELENELARVAQVGTHQCTT